MLEVVVGRVVFDRVTVRGRGYRPVHTGLAIRPIDFPVAFGARHPGIGWAGLLLETKRLKRSSVRRNLDPDPQHSGEAARNFLD